MHSRLEDDAQYEWCRQWEEEHQTEDHPEEAEEDQTGSALV